MASVDIYQMTTKDTNHKVAPVTIFDAVVNPQNAKTLDQEFEDMVGAVDESVTVDDADATLVTTALRKTTQTLTLAEQLQARTNIDAVGSEEMETRFTETLDGLVSAVGEDASVDDADETLVTTALRSTAQTLTLKEKAQARTNINAADADTVASLSTLVETNKTETDSAIEALTAKSGLFADKPSLPLVGFPYFCTDRQTAEGALDGIVIYHKGEDVWVDALGRVVE